MKENEKQSERLVLDNPKGTQDLRAGGVANPLTDDTKDGFLGGLVKKVWSLFN